MMINANVGTLRLIVFGIRHGRGASQSAAQPEEQTVLEDSAQKLDW
jgi:hypothetical protein